MPIIFILILILLPHSGIASTNSTGKQEVLFSYLGKPISFKSEVKLSCRSRKKKNVKCDFQKDKSGRYWINQLPIGSYALTANVDENPSNLPRSPGDYYRYFQFQVHEKGNGPLRVTMQKLIHMIKPINNNGSVEGVSGPCDMKRHFEVPLFSLMSEAIIEFAWMPLEPSVTYHYTLWTSNCDTGGMNRIAYKQTNQLQSVESLPPNLPGEYYLFRITAVHNGEMVGNYSIHDDGGFDIKQYRFRVVDPLWLRPYIHSHIYYVIAAFLVILLIVLGKHSQSKNEPSANEVGRVSRNAWIDLIGVILIISIAAGGYFAYEYFQHKQADKLKAENKSKNEIRQAHMRAEFELKVPIPKWWSDLPPPKYLLNHYTEVVRAFRLVDLSTEGIASRRGAIKQCYLSIVAHANDDNLVNACLAMISQLMEDDDIVQKVTEFGLNNYFYHKHPTNYCKGCMPGDQTASLVTNAATVYRRRGDYEKSLRLINKFLHSREKETAPYKLMSLHASLGQSYWETGDQKKAIEVLEYAKKRYGIDQSRGNVDYYLSQYKGGSKASSRSKPGRNNSLAECINQSKGIEEQLNACMEQDMKK